MEKMYLVIFEDDSEIVRMTKKEISELSCKDHVEIIDGVIIKAFDSQFDIAKLI